MPLPKVPQQGDAARIQQLASGLKRENGTYGAVVQRTPAGRPVGTGGTPAPRESQQFQVPPEHQSLAGKLAEAEAARQFWETWAQRYPGPNAQFYLQQAESDAQEAMEAFYGATPNFET